MTQKTIKIFMEEIYSKPPKKIISLTKPMFIKLMTSGLWIFETKVLNVDLEDYGPETIRGYRYVLVVIDNFSKYGWTVPLKKCSNIE